MICLYLTPAKQTEVGVPMTKAIKRFYRFSEKFIVYRLSQKAKDLSLYHHRFTFSSDKFKRKNRKIEDDQRHFSIFQNIYTFEKRFQCFHGRP